MEQVILGTAGHIDHGKTSLVRALTGIDTDRLKEEKQRGITIELGFAYYDLPNGRRLGIVDVPGHERFVKNMVAGATGIDLVAMIIAADEGIMPQTREHMDICTLLGIRHGLVVVTKTDMVEEEWLELVQEEVADFTHGTFLEKAPVVPVSAVTGQGLENLVHVLDELTRNIPVRSAGGLFRLPVDRVFSMKGFGTVITGTLISGRVATGDPVMLYPSGITAKVRGIQVQNSSVEQAEAGMRTAINFQGLEKEQVQRGDVLAHPNSLISSYMVDLHVQYLAGNSRPLKNRTRVRFHTGTCEVLGNLMLMGTDDLQPGQALPAQIRLDTPVSVVREDRFVLRSYSPVHTIAGGFVLNPVPPKHKRLRPDVVARITELIEPEPQTMIAHLAAQAGHTGVTFRELRIMTSLPDKLLEKHLQELLTRRALLQIDKETRLMVHDSVFGQLMNDARDFLATYHQAWPLKAGMSKEELKSRLPAGIKPRLFNLLLTQMVKDEQVALEDDLVRLSSHKVSLGQDQKAIQAQLIGIYQEAGLQPPYFKELCSTLNIEAPQARDVLMLLVSDGHLIKTKDDLFFDAAAVAALKDKLVAFLQARGQISTSEFKEMTGASRKYTIPLIEYFDGRNITIRIGDNRQLRTA